MWKKYKSRFQKWYHNHFETLTKEQQLDNLDINNHKLKIRGINYFLARAQVTDITEMIDVQRSVSNGNTTWDEVTFEKELTRLDDRLYLIIRKNDKLLAYAGCSMNCETKEAHITNLAVLPNYQGRGLGEFLMRTLLYKARYMNMKEITLEVRINNSSAQKLYKKLGFQQYNIKHNYYSSSNEDALDMRVILSND